MNNDKPEDKLVHAYSRMLEQVHRHLDQSDQSLDQAISKARNEAVEKDHLAPEDAERIAVYLHRDLSDLNEHLQKPDQDIKGWLHIDLSILEASIRDMLLSVADKAGPQLASFSHEGEPIFWYTGEVTAPGKLRCTSCNETLTLTKPARIPPCPKCNATQFVRI